MIRAPAARILIVGLIALTAACGGQGNAGNPTARSQPRLPSLLGEADGSNELDVRPRWERVRAFSGRGDEVTPPFLIANGAIQWRARWRCDKGRLVVRVLPRAASGQALVNHPCDRSGEAFAVERGRLRLSVEANGPWNAIIQQEVDTPLVEPPLREMGPSASLLSEGRFFGVDEEGKGRALVYELPGGRLAVRLEDFWVTPNVDLELWTSTLAHPKTSKQIFNSAHSRVQFLKATAGSHNYVLPRELTAGRVLSLAIWCRFTHEIYAAASLTP